MPRAALRQIRWTYCYFTAGRTDLGRSVSGRMMEPELGLGFFQSRTPDSVTHHFIRLPLGFHLNGKCLASLSDRRHSEGSETGLREEGPRFFLGIGEIRVQGVRLRKQKHLRKNLRLQFHVLLISSLTGMPGGERARHCRRLGGAPWGECPVYPVLTRCPGLRAPDGTRQTRSLVS